jgi:hypothetical protein
LYRDRLAAGHPRCRTCLHALAPRRGAAPPRTRRDIAAWRRRRAGPRVRGDASPATITARSASASRRSRAHPGAREESAVRPAQATRFQKIPGPGWGLPPRLARERAHSFFTHPTRHRPRTALDRRELRCPTRLREHSAASKRRVGLQRLQKRDQGRAIGGGHLPERLLRRLGLAAVPEDRLFERPRPAVVQIRLAVGDAFGQADAP